MLEYPLHAPEAATSEHGGLNAVGRLSVQGGSGDDHGVFRGAHRRDTEAGDRPRSQGCGIKRKAAELVPGHGIPLGDWRNEAEFRVAVTILNRLGCSTAPRYAKGAAAVQPDTH